MRSSTSDVRVEFSHNFELQNQFILSQSYKWSTVQYKAIKVSLQPPIIMNDLVKEVCSYLPYDESPFELSLVGLVKVQLMQQRDTGKAFFQVVYYRAPRDPMERPEDPGKCHKVYYSMDEVDALCWFMEGFHYAADKTLVLVQKDEEDDEDYEKVIARWVMPPEDDKIAFRIQMIRGILQTLRTRKAPV